MPPSFPFFTPEILEADETDLLGKFAVEFPQTAGEIQVVEDVLPSLNRTVIARQILQSICDRLNAISHATPPNAATGAVATG